MKRKRGNKKGKPKRPTVVAANEAILNVVSINTDDNSGLDGFENDECDSRIEVDKPTTVGTNKPEKLASINSDGQIDKTAGKLVYGRVKVKIKTSKALDSQLTSSDAPTQSDTDKSSQQVGLEKPGVISEKMEDSANSLSEINTTVSGNPSKKAGSIKIKSSRGFGSSSKSLSSDAALVQGERTQRKEPELLRQDPQHKKQELSASLSVIKKVMKMDAAEPFNVPVNPIALGIPDYFDVIDTPMDFGTICSNLENGVKYMNSEDVYRDVQYIWENCYKYNNKGDYIMDLMKRVKKNFMKYWTAAGLYNEQPHGVIGVETIQARDIAASSHVKMQVNSGYLKQKTRKRHGVKRHKDDCLCAICVMMRRRQEREESTQTVEDQIGASNSHLAQEETSPVESPYDEDISSNMDNSLGPDADADSEGKGEEVKMETTEQLYSPLQDKQEIEMEIQTKGEGEISEHSQLGDRSGEEHDRQYQTQTPESGGYIQTSNQKEEILLQHDEKTVAIEPQKEKLSEKSQKAKLYENFRCLENPMLLKVCGTLFPDDRKSVWTGHHSLARNSGPDSGSRIHAAVTALMK
ncbi:uncharacterized protein LOC132300495 isoform X2 [Cornus florida]|uniref:uncharacterized protein LOC132300495 isoform X2 n=1 Tax=Cornus florida TaxID=4283 RepID=UPI0028A08C4D|nr:uncharacterized protein LOC132300495 isoform X2 [Cornus florida]